MDTAVTRCCNDNSLPSPSTSVSSLVVIVTVDGTSEDDEEFADASVTLRSKYKQGLEFAQREGRGSEG